jgi:hypothetical protein
MTTVEIAIMDDSGNQVGTKRMLGYNVDELLDEDDSGEQEDEIPDDPREIDDLIEFDDPLSLDEPEL